MHCLVCKRPIPKNSPRRLCKEHSDAHSLFKSVDMLKSEDLAGKSPNIFVGRYGYPYVNVGILSPPERQDDAWLYDAPRFWAQQDFGKQNVISLRSSLINSRFKSKVKSQGGRMLDIAQEISMASKPVDVDVSLVKRPSFRLNINDITMPHGPRADIKHAKLAENPKIPLKVDKIVSDIDLKSTEGLKILYRKGVEENNLIKLLSVGNLGVKAQRRLVPTRWSITAVHDQLGKHLIQHIKDFNSADYQLYFGGYMNNFFLVMIFPDVWSFELFETYVPDNPTPKELDYTTDHESYDGRKKYADNCVGGYYSCRLGVLEKLKSMHKQATVLVLRFTTSEYNVPLGVWVVLEATRRSMLSKPIGFDSRGQMLSYAKNLIQERFNIGIDQFLSKSKILNNLKTQKKLTSFL